MSNTSNRWIRYRTAAYLRGRGFSWGIDGLFPQKAKSTSKFLINIDNLPAPNVAVCDVDFRVLAPSAFDYAFFGPKLEQEEKAEELVTEAAKKLKEGGHLMIHSHTDPLRWVKWGKWRRKAHIVRNQQYLVVLKKVGNGKGEFTPGIVDPTRELKRACVVRYGAIGDAVMITPLLRHLRAEGFHVTLNITPYAAPIFDNNPHVDNIIFQEREAIPNEELGEYWKEWGKEYDRYINLSESIEGSILRVEGRRDFYTDQQWRNDRAEDNYGDRTLRLGGYPDAVGERPELHLSPAEVREAQTFRREHRDNFVVLWGLNGSSAHKFHAFAQPIIEEFCSKHPEALVMLMGDERAKGMEFDHPQVVRCAGKFSLRQTITLASVADLVVGPESALVNIASAYPTPKLTFLSHSTHQNLCKWWENDYCLAPSPELSPCYPCHQLHYTEESCPRAELVGEDGEVLAVGPACAMGAISPERVLERMEEIYDRHFEGVRQTSSCA